MRYEYREGEPIQEEEMPFSVIPNDMLNALRDMDAKLSTKRVLTWLLKEVVSETKYKIKTKNDNGDDISSWIMPAEGFAAKTWISDDLGISTDTVEEVFKELKQRHVLDTVPDKWKKYKVRDHGLDIYYTRETTYVVFERDTTRWDLTKKSRKRAVASS